MSTIFEVRIYKSFGGRTGKGEQHSNVYHITSDNALADPALVTEVNTIVTFEKELHTTRINFMRAVVKPYAVTGRDPSNLRTIALSGTGTKDPGVNEIEPKEITVKVNLTTTLGRAGGGYYRGVVAENQVDGDPDGVAVEEGGLNFIVTNAWGVFMGLANHATIVLPVKGDTSAGDARPVLAMTYAGIVIKRATNRRKHKVPSSPLAAVESALQTVLTLIGISSVIKKVGSALPLVVKGNLIVALRRVVTVVSDILVDMGEAAIVLP